jgi:hypothetical protein
MNRGLSRDMTARRSTLLHFQLFIRSFNMLRTALFASLVLASAASPETSIIQGVGEHLVQRKQKAQEIPQDVFKSAIVRLKSRKADKVESVRF